MYNYIYRLLKKIFLKKIQLRIDCSLLFVIRRRTRLSSIRGNDAFTRKGRKGHQHKHSLKYKEYSLRYGQR